VKLIKLFIVLTIFIYLSHVCYSATKYISSKIKSIEERSLLKENNIINQSMYIPEIEEFLNASNRNVKNNSSNNKVKIAKAIDKLYKNISYKEAIKVVDETYKYADKYSIKATLVLGLIATESNFNRTVKSKDGAIGYTQVVPKWHADKIKGRNLRDPMVNIEVGMKILRECLNKYNENTNMALGCYSGSLNKNHVNKYSKKVLSKKEEIVNMAFKT